MRENRRGEAARVNLATILAMQKLVNSNCDGDMGLDLLVLDEILEAVDEAGLASMFEALNSDVYKRQSVESAQTRYPASVESSRRLVVSSYSG